MAVLGNRVGAHDPGLPRGDALRAEGRDRGIRLVCGDHGEEPDAEVPRAFGALQLESAEVREHAEDGCRRPRGTIYVDPRALRQHAGEVRGDATSCDVTERVDAPRDRVEQTQERERVEAGRLEELLAPRAAEVRGLRRVGDSGATHDVTDERVPVGMRTAGCQGEDHVARAHPLGAEHGARLDDAGRSSRDVVVVHAQKARVLGRLAADERGAGELAPRRDAAHDVGDALGEHLAARDVVGHEERLRAHDDDVVDDHADEILADRVVLVDHLRDRHLRPDPVGRGREQRLGVTEQCARVEEAREAADAAEDLGAVGAPDGRLHQFDGEISRRGVDAGFGIGILWGMGHTDSLPGGHDGTDRAGPGRRRDPSLVQTVSPRGFSPRECRRHP